MKIHIASSPAQSLIESVVDGTGLRLVLFTTGCSHRCPGCQNPGSWRLESGPSVSVAELADHIAARFSAGGYAGLTLSGGDPFYQEVAVSDLVDRLRRLMPRLNIWCYTGFVYDDLIRSPLLRKIDVLVDGRFIREQMTPKKPFRGSANQRVLYLSDGRIIREA